MPHIIIFIKIFSLLSGVSICLYFLQAGKTTKDPVGRSLFYYFAFSALIIFFQLLQSYFQINIERFKYDIPSILWMALLYGLLWALFLALNRVIVLLLGQKAPSHFFPVVISLALIWGLLHITGIVTYSFTTPYLHLCPGVALQLLPLLFIVGMLIHSLWRVISPGRNLKREMTILFGLLLTGYATYLTFSLITSSANLITSLAQLFIMIALFGWFRKFRRERFDPMLPLAKDELVEMIGTAYEISNREKEVLALLMEGKSNKEMEQSLFLAASTIKNHVSAIYAKLGINSRGQLMSLILKIRDTETTRSL